MNLGIIRIINSQPVFSNPKDNNVNFIIGDRSLQLISSSSSLSIVIPYMYMDNIIIDNNIFTLNLNKSIDTQLGSTSFLNLLTHNSEQVIEYVRALGRKNPKVTVHSINDFSPETSDTLRVEATPEENIVEFMMDLSISSDYYARIDSFPSSMLNCNVYVTLASDGINFHNRRGYEFVLLYSDIVQIDVFESGLYLYTHAPIYPFGNKEQSILVIYTSEPNSLLVSIKAHYR